MRTSRFGFLAAALVAVGCSLAACGDDVGDDTPVPDSGSGAGGSAGTAGTGGTGGAKDAGKDGSGGTAGAGTGGAAGAGGAKDAAGDTAGSAGTAGAAGAGGAAGAAGSPVDSGADVKADTGADVSVGVVDAGADAQDSGADVSAVGSEAGPDGGSVDSGADAKDSAPADAAPADAKDAATADANDGATAAQEAGSAEAGEAGAVTTLSFFSNKPASCTTCIQTDLPDGCALSDFSCEGFTDATKKQNCYNTLSCVTPTTCVRAAYSDLAPCYCGTASGSACLSAGAANGVCKAVIETGLASTDPNFIAGHTTDPTLGTGAAMALLSCIADVSNGNIEGKNAGAAARCASCF